MVWLFEDNITPGDNWAKKVGKAFDDAEWMVLLLTPAAMESDSLRQDIEFALGSRRMRAASFRCMSVQRWRQARTCPGFS